MPYIAKALDTKSVKAIEMSFLLIKSFVIAFNGECLRAILVLPSSLVMESNKYQRAMLCCVQHAVHLGLVMEDSRAQYLRFKEKLRPPNINIILG